MGSVELSLDENDKAYFLFRVMIPCYKKTMPDSGTILSLISWGCDQILKFWNGIAAIIKDNSNPEVVFNKINNKGE
jgi:hypothetical protein